MVTQDGGIVRGTAVTGTGPEAIVAQDLTNGTLWTSVIEPDGTEERISLSTLVQRLNSNPKAGEIQAASKILYQLTKRGF